MKPDPQSALSRQAARFLGKSFEELDPTERHVLNQALLRRPVAVNTSETFEDDRSRGDRLADQVAKFGGSWAFIGSFGAFLAVWILVNTLVLPRAFDPYPFIFLNLMLSMLAAIQAPVILMSQNRQAAKDRLDARHDYEINLKAEIEIMALHDKLDALRSEDLAKLIASQQRQIELLSGALAKREPGT